MLEGEDGELTLVPTPALPTPDRRSATGVVFARRRRVALADVVVALADVVIAFVFVVTVVVDSFPFVFVFTLEAPAPAPAPTLESTFWSC